MNSATVVKVGFLVVLLGAIAAGATATSGWLVEDPAESTPGESTATTPSVADGATTPTANDSTTATTEDGATLVAAVPAAVGQ